MKSVRFLAAGAALFLLASCGKEYNSVPGGNLGDNPLLPLGTADQGQIRYNLWSDKIRIYNAYRSDTLLGTTSQRRVVGVYTATDGSFQSFSMYFPTADTVKKEYTSKDSVVASVGFQNADDITGSSIRIYTNQVSGAGFRVTFTTMDATTLRGTFSGTLIRQYQTTDTGDKISITNGTFWVKK